MLLYYEAIKIISYLLHFPVAPRTVNRKRKPLSLFTLFTAYAYSSVHSEVGERTMFLMGRKRKQYTASDFELYRQVVTSGKLILLDLFFYTLFFVIMFYSVPVQVYVSTSIVFALYLMTSLCLYLQSRKKRKRAINN